MAGCRSVVPSRWTGDSSPGATAGRSTFGVRPPSDPGIASAPGRPVRGQMGSAGRESVVGADGCLSRIRPVPGSTSGSSRPQPQERARFTPQARVCRGHGQRSMPDGCPGEITPPGSDPGARLGARAQGLACTRFPPTETVHPLRELHCPGRARGHELTPADPTPRMTRAPVPARGVSWITRSETGVIP